MFDLVNIEELYKNLGDDKFLRIFLSRNDLTINIDRTDKIKIRNGVLMINRITGSDIIINPDNIIMVMSLAYNRKF